MDRPCDDIVVDGVDGLSSDVGAGPSCRHEALLHRQRARAVAVRRRRRRKKQFVHYPGPVAGSLSRLLGPAGNEGRQPFPLGRKRRLRGG